MKITALVCMMIAGVYLGLFYIWGRAFLTFLHDRIYFSNSVLFGFTLMISVYQILYLPFFLGRGSYRALTFVWLLLLAGATGFFVWRMFSQRGRNQLQPASMGQWVLLALTAIFLAWLCLRVAFHPRPYGADTNYYISVMNDMVYRDFIYQKSGMVDVHHGLNSLFAFFGTASLITGLPPFYLELHTMRFLGVALTAIGACSTGRLLFQDGKRRLSWPGLGLALAVPVIFMFWNSMYGSSFFWQRTNEAKAYCQLIFFPTSFMTMLRFFCDSCDHQMLWREQALIGFSAIPIAVSSMSAYPFFVFIGLAALLVYTRFHRAGFEIGHAALCVLPNLLYLVLYYASRNWIVF